MKGGIRLHQFIAIFLVSVSVVYAFKGPKYAIGTLLGLAALCTVIVNLITRAMPNNP